MLGAVDRYWFPVTQIKRILSAMRSPNLIILLCAVLCFSAIAADNKPTTNPAEAAIRAALENTQDVPDVKDIYNEALLYVQQRQQLQQDIDQYQRWLKQPPKKQPNSNAVKLDERLLESNSLAKILPAETELKAGLVSLQSQLRDNQEQLEQLDSRLTKIPAELVDSRQQYETVKNQTATEQGNPRQAAIKTRRDAHLAMLEAKIQALELEQLVSPNRQELARRQIENINDNIAKLNQFLVALAHHKDELQKQQTERSLAESDRAIGSDNEQNPQLKSALALNRSLADELVTQQKLREKAQQQLTEAEQIDRRIKALIAELKQSSEWLGLSVELSRGMTEQLLAINAMPTQNLGQIAFQLNQIRLAQYRYQREQDKAKRLSQGNDDAMAKLASARLSLLNQLQGVADEAEQLLRRLQTQINSSVERRTELRKLVSEELVWRPNVYAFSKSLLPNLIEQVSSLFKALRAEAGDIVHSGWAAILPLAIILLAWAYGLRLRRRFIGYLQHIAPNIGNVRRDKVYYTPLAVLLSLVLGAWLPVFAYFSLSLLGDQYSYFADLLMVLTLCIGVRLSLRLMLSEQGALTTHYHLSSDYLDKLIRAFSRVLPFVGMSVLWLVWANRMSADAWVMPFGRLGVLVSSALVLVIFHWLVNHIEPLVGKREHWPFRYRLVSWLAYAMPTLTLFLFLIGYILAGSLIFMSVQLTVLSFLLIMLALYVTLRVMTVLLRRVAFERALARRNEALAKREADKNGEQSEESASSESSIEVVEENAIPLDDIGQQSMKMVSSFALLLFYLSLLPIWSALFNTFGELNEWTLWTVTQGAGEATTQVDITVKAAVTAIITAIFTGISIRNLPGLLELLVIQNLSLPPGTGYAITTVTKYLILVVGLLLAVSLLGLEWSQLQWLVAALTVGLGFGLQEIFANFVSGLIILFEKPIRIGDTITIRNWSGTITKINTRATTVVDWDRKEVLIPNKAFVTEDFVNWTLSDAITRIVISVGVAYGSDVELVQKTLLEAADHVSILLDDPKPEVYFLQFGDSALQFELRAFVSQLGSRLPATHQIHQWIDRLFEQRNIEICFPQMDLHIRDVAEHKAPPAADQAR